MEITKEILEKMKEKATIAKFEADAFQIAYEDAVATYWRRFIQNALGLFVHRANNGVEAVIDFSDSPNSPVLLRDISVTYEGIPTLIYSRKTKGGKWGKSEYSTEVEKALQFIRKKEG